MLASETKIFLHLPSESTKTILHPATVKEPGEHGHTAELEEPDVALEAGQDIFVFYELKRKFVKQAARIDAIMQTDPTLVVGFEVTGEIVSAENREWYRVSTGLVSLTMDFGDESGCPLLDVSSVGLAVEATKRYEIGHLVPATLHHGGRQYSGTARIQSIRELGGDRYRYGVHSVQDKASGGDLRKGQQLISASLEREQLRRLAGSG
ncbi:MAG: hypothetical protein ACYTGF_00220 [Planctomycetota bacterium]|jgi:hypothetical protein